MRVDATRLVEGERVESKGRTHRVSEIDASSLTAIRPVLINIARHRTTITYGQLKAAAGLSHIPSGMGRLLDLAKIDCDRCGEPDLAALVVNSVTQEVGDRYGTDAESERQHVYRRWS